MSWKNQVVETEDGSACRVTGRKVREIPLLVAEYVVTDESTGLEIGVIDSQPAKGARGAEVIRFNSHSFTGFRHESRTLAEAVDQLAKDFEGGSTEVIFGLFD